MANNGSVTGALAVQRAANMVGGQNALARAIGARQSTIWEWIHNRPIPPEQCPAVSRATGGIISVHELRPDLSDIFRIDTRSVSNVRNV